MKTRMFGLVVGVSALATWVTACDQPRIDCRASRGTFVAKYELVSGSGACSELVGELIGLQSYYPVNESDQKTVDLTRSFLVIRSETLGNLNAEATDHGDKSTVKKAELDSTGDFASVDPTDSNICSVAQSTAAEIDTNEIPAVADDPATPEDDESYAGLPATNVKYEWKNVRVLASPAAPGNLMEAELTYTENGCSATYSVIGLWPAIGCEEVILVKNDKGLLVAKGTGKPNDALCDAIPDPQAPYSNPVGSGINQDFVPRCDKDLLFCVATKRDLIDGDPR